MTERQDRHSVGAILAVDAVGYSRLMGKDEEATLKRLHDYRGLIGQIVGDHGGVIEFDSEPRHTQFRLMLPIVPAGEEAGP